MTRETVDYTIGIYDGARLAATVLGRQDSQVLGGLRHLSVREFVDASGDGPLERLDQEA